MPLTNYKHNLKLKWTKIEFWSQQVLIMIILILIILIWINIKDTKLCVPKITLSAKENQKISKLLIKCFKDLHIEMNIKEKVIIKIRYKSIDNSSSQTLKDLTDFLFWFIPTKMAMVWILKVWNTKSFY